MLDPLASLPGDHVNPHGSGFSPYESQHKSEKDGDPSKHVTKAEIGQPDPHEHGPVSPPTGWRRSRLHKILTSVPKRNTYGVGSDLGSRASHRGLHKSEVDGRIASALERLFRSKSQKARFTLELLQCSLVGHVIDVDRVSIDAAPFLRTANGLVLVQMKPSFRATRLLVSALRGCRRTNYVLTKRLKDIIHEELA
jgi:hypothetical protein